jgi:hypothetical protein
MIGVWSIQPLSDQAKEYKIGICYYYAKQAALRGKIKDWFAQNLINV